MLAAVKPDNAPAIPPLLTKVRKITFIGDSITHMPNGFVERFGLYLNSLYPDRHWEITEKGQNGDTSSGVAKRFKVDAVSTGSDLIVVLVGINDFVNNAQNLQDANFEERLIEQFEKNIGDMIKDTKEAKRQMVLMSPIIALEEPGIANKMLAHMCAALKQQALKENIPFVDLHTPFVKIIEDYRKSTGAVDRILTYDGVHPNGCGHQIVVNSLLDALGVSTADRRLVQPNFSN